MLPLLAGIAARGMGAFGRAMGPLMRAGLLDGGRSVQPPRISVTVKGVDDTIRFFNELPRQLRKEVASEINRLANATRDDFLWDLPNRMTLRTSWFKPGNMYGFNVRQATSSNLSAEIYSRAPWLQLQETGGRKTPRKQHLAIPTTNVRRTKRDLISKVQRPQALGNKLFDIRTKKGTEFLAMRVGRGKKAQLKFMYTLARGAQIPPRLQFYSRMNRFIDQNARLYLSHAVDRAIARVW